eukprot:1067251-Amorphochlora_amoeboformis.AAC.1
MMSVGLNTPSPEKVHFWIVTTNLTAVELAKSYVDTGLGRRSMKIHALHLDDITEQLEEDGIRPVWTWEEYGSSVVPGTNQYRL